MTYCSIKHDDDDDDDNVKTAHLKDKVSIVQAETIPNIRNGTMFGDCAVADMTVNGVEQASISVMMVKLVIHE